MTPDEGGNKMRKHSIAVLPGDGIGPEVVSEARKVVEAAGELFEH